MVRVPWPVSGRLVRMGTSCSCRPPRERSGPKATWEFNDIDAIKHAVAAGLGVAILAAFLATLRGEHAEAG